MSTATIEFLAPANSSGVQRRDQATQRVARLATLAAVLAAMVTMLSGILSGLTQGAEPVGARRVATAQRRPNILVILVDDLGYGDLACYGAPDLKTPHIDELVASGLRMNQFYANCPVCSPTRASLLTGRYPELVGVPGVIRTFPDDNWGWLDPRAQLLPTLLGSVGYHSALIGKWHLGLRQGQIPNDRGFDFFHGFLGDMMDDYYEHRRHGINYMRLDRRTIEPTGHATDLFSQWACDYLLSRTKEKTPFFLYLAYNAPHTPIQPPEEWLQRVREREPTISQRRAKLVALIEHLDDGIGRVLQCLQATGLDANTLIVFTSDNGGQLSAGANNGPLRDGKQSMYEGGLRVPACFVWPGQIQGGTVSDRVALTMDLLPTLCDVADVPVEHKIDGISLLPTLRGEPQETAARDLFFHRREGGRRYGGLTIQAVRRGPWKLLQNSPFAPLELYHLADDPGEQRDQAKTQPKIFDALSASLRRQLQRGGAVPWQPPDRRDAP